MSAAFRTIASATCELGVGEEAGHDRNRNQAYSVQYFFHSIYQQQPALFRGTHDVTTTRNPDGSYDSNASALHRAFDIGWDDVAALLHHCRREYSTAGTSPPLFFQKGVPVTDPFTLYASNPHAAYLDGCSVIINHADLHHLTIARLCDDLQQSFPHVYANAYLTPASSHAVSAHADDRDVLVFQILGKKKWKVYKKVPVEYPFDKEQVGKNGKAVDSSVLKGGLCFNGNELILHPGDVLYLPRGYVHEATTENINDVIPENDPSFHITVAIATHDWCLSVLLSETIRETLDGLPKFRRALPIGPCKEYESFSQGDNSGPCLRQVLDNAMDIIQGHVTPSLLENKLRKKYLLHNEHAAKHRETLMMMNQCKKRRVGPYEYVGDDAATHVTLNSIIRVSTQEERSSVTVDEGCLRGLTVREETMQILMTILSNLKSDTMLRVKVKDLRDIIETEDSEHVIIQLSMLCEFTLLSFARCCVELGALAIEVE